MTKRDFEEVANLIAFLMYKFKQNNGRFDGKRFIERIADNYQRLVGVE